MKWIIKEVRNDALVSVHKSYRDACDNIKPSQYIDVEFSDTEEFVKWMNKEFLDPHNHGKLCNIGRADSEYYWFDYLRPLGCDIAWCVANGVEQGWYRKSDDYVQYIDGGDYFITFNTIDDYYDTVMSKEGLLYELECRV